jgi:hypothetical protein
MRHGLIKGWPYTTFPTGWFQVAWAPEIGPGEVVTRRYWARDLVIWRGASGQLHALDAHETRRGVDLGRWGRVEGDALVNSVDGWAWQPDGSVVTPNGRDVASARYLRSFPVHETMGLVLAWYDHAGNPPDWNVEVAAEAESPDFYPAWPHSAVLAPMSCQPQVMAENIADVVHIHYAHRWVAIPTITEWEEVGPRLEVGYEGRFPSPRGPVDAVFHNTAYGFGVLETHMDSIRKFLHFICPTPVDHQTMDVRLSAWVGRAEGDTGDVPDKVAQALVKAQQAEVLGPVVDRTIWENQAYLVQAGFRSQERKYISFRKWSEQFYPHDPVSAAAQ